MGILRLRVYRYRQSRKLVAIQGRQRAYQVFELPEDMRGFVNIRQQKTVHQASLESTNFKIELRETEVERTRDSAVCEYRLVRVLSPEDTDLTRWAHSANLASLPVSPETELTPEERFWCGEREGNIGGGAALVVLTAGAAAISIAIGTDQGLEHAWFFLVVLFVAGWGLLGYQWRPSSKPNGYHVAEVMAYKELLRNRNADRDLTAQTTFEKSLQQYATWELLSPEQFEHAVSVHLRKIGYRVSKVTQYSRDGGIITRGLRLPWMMATTQSGSLSGA